MSAISTILTRLANTVALIRSAIYAIDVRDDIADAIEKCGEAIEQCYSDVSNPTLQTEALEAALQEKIDQGEMAALTIGDRTITAVKLANGVIPAADATLTTSGGYADAAETGRQIGNIKADLDDVNESLDGLANALVYRGRIVNELHYTAIAQCEAEGTYYFNTAEAASITDLPANWITGGLVIRSYNCHILIVGGRACMRIANGGWSDIYNLKTLGKTEFIKVSAKSLKETTFIPNLYAQASNGKINFIATTTAQYDTYFIVFPNNTQLYFDNDLPDGIYLSLCVGDAPVGELTPVADVVNTKYYITCENPVRYRKTTTENSLPYGIENAIDVSGKLVCFTYDNKARDTTFNVKGIGIGQILPQVLSDIGDSTKYPISQSGIKKILSEPQKVSYFQYVTNSYGENLYIWIPSNKDYYIEYIFEHTVLQSKNADVWRVTGAYLCDRELKEVVGLTVGGEWECALRLKDRDDFSGGRAHGDETYTSVEFIVDGVSIDDVTTYTQKTAFSSIRILQNSNLYDPNDSTTIIAKHMSEHIFSQGEKQLKINQTIQWLGNYDIASCFLAMFPIAKTVSSKWYNDYSYKTSDIEFGRYSNITDVVLVGYSNKIRSKFGIEKYINENYINNGTFKITDNSGLDYNKCYYAISESGSNEKAGEVTASTIWQAKSYYSFFYC